MNKPIIIIGNGGHALVLAEILLLNHREILGYTAPYKGSNSFGLHYLGTDEVISTYDSTQIELVLGVGSIQPNNIRMKIFQQFKERGYCFANCIHPKTILSSTAIIQEGAQIMAGVIIQPLVKIHQNVIVNTGVQIDHECEIFEHVHLAPGTVLSGNVQIGKNVHIGTGAKIIQSIVVGENSMVAAGAVVVKNIPINSKVMGIPAKEVE